MAQNFEATLIENLSKIQELVKIKETLREICLELGYCDNGRNTGRLSKYLRANNIGFSHFRTSKAHPKNEVECVCPQCGNTFIKNLNNGKSAAKVTCSHACGNIYFAWKQGTKSSDVITAYAAKLSKFYKEQELEEECVVCGEKSILDVHHVDHDRNNANLNNLVYLCPNHHLLLHRKGDETVCNKIVENLDFRDSL